MTIRTCVLYARLSVTKEESVSIARQLQSCRKYAEGRGWEVLGEFVDDGVSATANRPEDRRGWAALLNASNFDAVVIWKVDRLARRVLDFLHVDEALQERGAGLVAVEDPIDMTTPMGRAFATILAVFGEMEAAAISSRIRAAREHLVKEGRFVGGGIPYGYRSAPNPDGAGRVLERDPERWQWLHDAVSLALGGSTVNEIARWLTSEVAPMPANTRNGRRWHRQTVEQLLRNPTIAGMTPFNPGRKRSGGRVDPFNVVRDDLGEPIIRADLAVITATDFARLQSLLDGRDAPQAVKRHARQATSVFLSKVVRCDDCDVFLCRGTNQKRPVLYCPTCRQTISRDHLDPYVIARLLEERDVEDRWGLAGTDEWKRRDILLSQLDSLRIRRGMVGRRFDADRVLLEWAVAS